MEIVDNGTLEVADSHGTHGRLDTRTSRHAALVNRESLCGRRQWMGERQDWPITAPFLDRRSRRGRLGREMLAIAWLTAIGEEAEKARGAPCALAYHFPVPWGLQRWNSSCKRQNRTRGEIGGWG
jgi:hypothetical protein